MEYRIRIEEANRRAARYILLPVLVVAAVVFAACLSRWDFSFWRQAGTVGFWPWMLSYVMWLLLFVAALFAGVFVHEGIHGLLIALFAQGGFHSLDFGFDRQAMAPFAHARVPLRAWQMVAVCLGPLVLMGLVPFVAAVWIGSVFAYVLSVVFIVAAGGDILYVLLLRRVKAGTWVKDLPDAVGFSVAE